jgi:hypothetical protein
MKVHYLAHKSLSVVPISSQMKAIKILIFCFYKNNFNNPSLLCLGPCDPSFLVFQLKFFMHFLSFLCALHGSISFFLNIIILLIFVKQILDITNAEPPLPYKCARARTRSHTHTHTHTQYLVNSINYTTFFIIVLFSNLRSENSHHHSLKTCSIYVHSLG